MDPAGERAKAPERHEIRKYPNRRFYDVTDRRHVTLEDIHGLVIEGHDVRITDSRTGEDITAAVLTQIILKLDSPKLQFFPAELLHRLIRANEDLVQGFVEKYFRGALGPFVEAQRKFEDQMRQTFGMPGAPGGFPDWSQFPMGAFSPGFWAGAARGAGSGSGRGADEGAEGAEGEGREGAGEQAARGEEPDGEAAGQGEEPSGEEAARFRDELEALKEQVRALRSALSRQDGDEESGKPQPKSPD